MRLYHTGFSEIRVPDLHHGRKNADFGQGFYTSPDISFCRRWARERKGQNTYLNTYELETEGLNILLFERTAEWFDFIYGNRSSLPVNSEEYDVITGPVANDTIYDTFGIITSGLLSREDALKLLMIGPVYIQTVIRTEKASSHLHWLKAEILTPDDIASYRSTVALEEKEYQKLFSDELSRI